MLTPQKNRIHWTKTADFNSQKKTLENLKTKAKKDEKRKLKKESNAGLRKVMIK